MSPGNVFVTVVFVIAIIGMAALFITRRRRR